MKAKDTVMDITAAWDYFHPADALEAYDLSKLLGRQAEISFQAGMTEGFLLAKHQDLSLLHLNEIKDRNKAVIDWLDAIKKESMQGVVDWERTQHTRGYSSFDTSAGNDFLKTRGLK